MKLSTIAAALLLSSEAYAAQEVGRMRKVKIYSSSTLLRNVEFGRGVVDPYIGLADERGQRGLEEQLSTPTIGSMSATLDMSMPATSLTDQSFSLDLSMPATSLTDQSAPHVPVQGGANDLMAKAEKSDPYIGLPDERKQRGFEEQLSMPTIGSMSTNLEMSMPATSLTDQSSSLEMSMPATSSNDKTFSLEMSMPTTGLTDQSFSLEMSMSSTGLTDQSAPHVPVQGGANAVMAKVEKRENRAMTMGNVELGTDVVDPYIGLPDERKQRGVEELSMPTIGSMSTTLEMSMPVTSLTDQSFSLEMSMPATSSNDKSFSLEMSMPATGLTDQSISYPPVQGGAIGSMPPTTTLEIFSPEISFAPYLPVQGATADMMATAEIAENSAMTTGHSSAASVATIVSAVAGVVALV